MKTRLVIDSRARESGTVTNFEINLRPTMENIKKVSLVWSDIPTPLQSPGGPYFLIRIHELGTRTRVLGSTTTTVQAAAATTNNTYRRRSIIPGMDTLDYMMSLPGLATDAILDTGTTTDGTTGTTTDTSTGTTIPSTGVLPAQPPIYYNTTSGIETTFVVPVTVNVDERAFYSPETSYKQEINYTS